jgi:hypothetical protein
MSLSSSVLFRAAHLAEEIELLQKQVSDLLENQDLSPESPNRTAKTTEVFATKRRSKTPKATLPSAVLKVLRQSKVPLKAAGIYERLVSSGYNFSFKEPKKVLQIRLYKMGGVQKAGKGFFKAKQ